MANAPISNTQNIFGILVVDEYYQRIASLFNDKEITMNETDCVQRLIFVSHMYSQWIQYKQMNKSKDSLNMFDIIDTELGDNYNLNSFLNDYRFISHTNRNGLSLDEDGLFCDISQCFITSRHSRNRAQMSKENNQRREIFFVSDLNGDNEDETVNSIVIQQILDTLHYFLFHTLRFDVNKYLNKDNIVDTEDDDIDIDEICFDAAVKKIAQIIEKKIKSTKRFRANEDRYNAKNNKFMTTLTNESSTDVNIENETEIKSNDDQIAVYQSVVYGNDSLLLKEEKKRKRKKESQCWFDDLFKGMDRYKLKPAIIRAFITFIDFEEYDTDSVYDDINNNPNSIIIRKFRSKYNDNNNAHIFCRFLLKFSFEKGAETIVYSAGYRYFYWEYYRYNKNEWNVLYIVSNTGAPALEGNKGYSLCSWFIDKKYSNLKEEILNIEWNPFSFEQYQNVLITATKKRENWIKDETAKKLECWDGDGWIERMYGIKHGNLIALQHIMAIILYCNFTKHSFEFSKTFRKTNIYETDEALKERHSQYYHWGRYLRECVECFGTQMEETSIPIFYHGVSKQMLFNSTYISLKGPVSTTPDFIVAYTVFGSAGVVLDIRNDHTATMFWNCNFWSAHTNEDERLFIAGLNPVQFKDIHNIPKQTRYGSLIKLINIVDVLFTKGWPLYGIKPKSRDCSLLKILMKEEMNECYLDKEYSSSIPDYCSLLFHQFIEKTTEVEINWHHLDKHFKYHSDVYNCDVYGFAKFRSIFMCDDDTTFKCSLFVKLCQNLETMTIYKLVNSKRGFGPSINLNDEFVSEMLKCIARINERPHSVFKQIRIVEPIDSIDGFITKYSKTFSNKGWRLNKIEYEAQGAKSNETLLFEKN